VVYGLGLAKMVLVASRKTYFSDVGRDGLSMQQRQVADCTSTQ